VSDFLPSKRPLLDGTRRRVLTVAAATSTAAGVLGRYDGGAGGTVAAFAAVVLVVLAAIDIEQRRVPNAIVLPAVATVLAARVAIDPRHSWVWLAAAFGAAFVIFMLAIISPSGLGMGDVKLVLLIGATLGPSVVGGLLFGTVSAAIVGLAVIARHGRSARRHSLPYVPFLAFGTLCALLLFRP
jgi:leader peptidase (prepilin peptidase)/N-methyltransferase